MNKARFVLKPEDVAAVPLEERVYMGHPTCREEAWAWSECVPVDRAATLVLPPLRPRDDGPLASLLKRLRHMPFRDFELSVNDWGTLALCARELAGTPVTLCAGILLAGQDTDPRIAGFLIGEGQPARDVLAPDGSPAWLVYAPPPRELMAHWQTPSITGAFPLLKEWGIRRIELCLPSAGFPETFPQGLAVSVYAPNVLLTVFPCGDCAGCPREEIMLGRLGGKEVFRNRNMAYYRADDMASPAFADRWVSF